MKFVLFFFLGCLWSNSHAQNTYILSAGNISSIEFRSDTTLFIYYDDNRKFVKKAHYVLDTSTMFDQEFGEVWNAALIIIKNVPMKPGKYVIYGDQSFYDSYITLVFEVNKAKAIKILFAKPICNQPIIEHATIVFSSENK